MYLILYFLFYYFAAIFLPCTFQNEPSKWVNGGHSRGLADRTGWLTLPLSNFHMQSQLTFCGSYNRPSPPSTPPLSPPMALLYGIYIPARSQSQSPSPTEPVLFHLHSNFVCAVVVTLIDLTFCAAIFVSIANVFAGGREKVRGLRWSLWEGDCIDRLAFFFFFCGIKTSGALAASGTISYTKHFKIIITYGYFSHTVTLEPLVLAVVSLQILIK